MIGPLLRRWDSLLGRGEAAVTVPPLALTMPQMMLIRVVLPAPLGPSSANSSPRLISRSMPFSAWKPLS